MGLALPQLVRRGECSRCGECCFPDPTVSTGARLRFTADELADPDRIEGACPMLRVDGERYRCAGYGTHPFYLAGCPTFPGKPEDMAHTPSCTFTFETVT